MTCFWDGIISSLDIIDFNKISLDNIPKPKIFIEQLKLNNTKTNGILWNNQEITDTQLQENYDAIKNFDINSISNGYLCSTFDPFLFLIAKIFELNINHSYLGNNMNYKNRNYKKIVNYSSNSGHFVYKSKNLVNKTKENIKNFSQRILNYLDINQKKKEKREKKNNKIQYFLFTIPLIFVIFLLQKTSKKISKKKINKKMKKKDKSFKK